MEQGGGERAKKNEDNFSLVVDVHMSIAISRDQSHARL